MHVVEDGWFLCAVLFTVHVGICWSIHWSIVWWWWSLSQHQRTLGTPWQESSLLILAYVMNECVAVSFLVGKQFRLLDNFLEQAL